MTRAGNILETMNDFTKSDDEIVMRSNYRFGTRCPQCGRMLKRLGKLPATRTCPNSECPSTFRISKSNRGLVFKKTVNSD